MSYLTPEQQVEVLWKALRSTEYWISVHKSKEHMVLCRAGGNAIGPVMHQLNGTRDEIIEKLNALQVADRLEL